MRMTGMDDEDKARVRPPERPEGSSRRRLLVWVICWGPITVMAVISAVDPSWSVINGWMGY